MKPYARRIKHPHEEHHSHISSLLDPSHFIHILSKITVPGLRFNLASVFEHHGVASGLERQSVLDKPILHAPSMDGGVLSRIAASLVKDGSIHDQAKMHWQEVPRESLGSLSPMDTPGMEREIGLSR